MAQQTITTHPTLGHIRERGYWRTLIRPARFEPERIGDPQTLPTLIERNATHFRGWEFPSYQPVPPLGHGNDWIECAVDRESRLEYWRLYQSGQFLHYAALSEDWHTMAFRWHTRPGTAAAALLPVYDTVYRLTEIFEFAANLGLSRLYDAGNTMHIALLLHPLQGRQLYNDADSQRHIFLTGVQPAREGAFQRSFDIPLGELIANARPLALQAAEQLFHLFHWQFTSGLLQRIQDELVER